MTNNTAQETLKPVRLIQLKDNKFVKPAPAPRDKTFFQCREGLVKNHVYKAKVLKVERIPPYEAFSRLNPVNSQNVVARIVFVLKDKGVAATVITSVDNVYNLEEGDTINVIVDDVGAGHVKFVGVCPK